MKKVEFQVFVFNQVIDSLFRIKLLSKSTAFKSSRSGSNPAFFN